MACEIPSLMIYERVFLWLFPLWLVLMKFVIAPDKTQNESNRIIFDLFFIGFVFVSAFFPLLLLLLLLVFAAFVSFCIVGCV